MAYQNYGTTTYPVYLNSPLPELDTTNPSVAARIENGLAQTITAVKKLLVRDGGKVWIGTAAPSVTDLPNAEEGDGYIQTDGTNALHIYTLTSKANDTWSDEGSLQGPGGNAIHFGTAVTGTGTGISATVAGSKANDMYVNTSAFGIYQATAPNTWNYLGSLQGPAGAAGSAIFFGTVVTGTGTSISAEVTGSKATDTYINYSSWNVYQATAPNVWDYKGNIAGPQGAGSGWDVSTDSASTACSWTLANGAYKYFTNSAITSLTITDGLNNTGDMATVEFTSPSTAATYSAPSGSKHYGDDCSDGAFTPAASTTYKLVFEKWGAGLTCYVKARS